MGCDYCQLRDIISWNSQKLFRLFSSYYFLCAFVASWVIKAVLNLRKILIMLRWWLSSYISVESSLNNIKISQLPVSSCLPHDCFLLCSHPWIMHHQINQNKINLMLLLIMIFWFQITTRGCETIEMTLRRNSLGQLGFHVNFEGIVADVEPFGFAWKAGLRQGSRLVEICKVAVATLTHEQMIDLLRTSISVKVVVIQPHEDGTPRR